MAEPAKYWSSTKKRVLCNNASSTVFIMVVLSPLHSHTFFFSRPKAVLALAILLLSSASTLSQKKLGVELFAITSSTVNRF